jgi:GDP-4-dehydro-6-deoxy-D-mannose reductase
VAGVPLVTGGTGFAGSHLVDHLLEREARIAAWSNPLGRGTPLDARADRVAWSVVDLLDRRLVADAIERLRPSIVYHLAGFADVQGASRRPAEALRVNAMGTHHLLEAIRRARLDTPVLVAGSALVYRPSEASITEDSAIAPASPYGLSKLAQEMVATRARDLRVFVARPFNHAGPRQSSAYVTSTLARQIAEIEAGLREPVLHVGNLEARRDITDVRDTVQAYRVLVERGAPHRPYNVCSGRAYRVGDLMEGLLARAHTRIRTQVDPARVRPSDTPLVLGSSARIESETGWRPSIPIEQTLEDLLAYWRGVIKATGEQANR